jgi:hypothetical protein
VAPSGGHTQSEGETLDLLLATHFPNSVVMERGAVPVAACHAKRLEWQVGVRNVTYRKVRWAIDLPHIIVQVWTGYSLLCCKRDGGSYPLNGQDFSCLPGDWIRSRHMVPG